MGGNNLAFLECKGEIMNRRVVFASVFFTLIALTIIGCGISKEELAEEVKASITESIQNRGLIVEVRDVTLIKKNSKEYSGIVKLVSYPGTIIESIETSSITVTVDGKSFMWKFD
jgi:hypothetical protein